MTELRPAEVCRDLLAALDAAEGRRKKRKRDTTPDEIGLNIKRVLLEAAVNDDPAPENFEAWLFEQTLAGGTGSGGLHAMAKSVWDEWRLASSAPFFQQWLAEGAPSADRGD